MLCIKCNRRKPTQKRKLCNTCKSEEFFLRYPAKRAFHNLKNNAKRRGKEFNLSYDWFLKFVTDTNYIEKKGREPHSLSIDRIDNSKGYTEDNLQVITFSENASKGDESLNTEGGIITTAEPDF